MDRETGTATVPCPTCNRQLALETLPDGSVAAVNCTNCYPATLVELAAEESAVEPAREVGTDVAEASDD